jgi:hypothetical protein
MEPERTPPGVIAVFVPGLENTPGWLSLSRKKQDALLEHTSHIAQNRQLQKLGEFGELLELHHVQELLDGEQMAMKDYLRLIYPDSHKRTIDRKREVFSQITKRIPPASMRRLAAIGVDTLGRFDRIANAALGDISNVLNEMPTLSASTDKEAEKYLEELDSKLLESRQQRRKGTKKANQDETMAAKMAANALSHYMRSCGLTTSAHKRSWLTKVVGWAMEAQAVSGSISTTRVSIPGGVLIPRGRPRKKPKKEAA